jgi:hypothetical protein
MHVLGEATGVREERGRLDAQNRLALAADEHEPARAVSVGVKDHHHTRDLLHQPILLTDQIAQALSHLSERFSLEFDQVLRISTLDRLT